MASVKSFKQDGSAGSEVNLNESIFDIEPNVGLIHQVTMALLNNKRQGNAETKVRKEVRGGGRKPFKQKGTGNARQGSTREPHMRGGGVVFGPHKTQLPHGSSFENETESTLLCVDGSRAQRAIMCSGITRYRGNKNQADG